MITQCGVDNLSYILYRDFKNLNHINIGVGTMWHIVSKVCYYSSIGLIIIIYIYIYNKNMRQFRVAHEI